MAQVVVVGAVMRLRDQVVQVLRENDHLVTVVDRPGVATTLVRSRRVDLLVLVAIGHVPVGQACRDIRRFSTLPVFVIGPAEESDSTKLLAFAGGADDYLEFPFNPDELLARSASLIRRSRSGDPLREVLEAGDLVIDRAGAEITVRGTHMQIPLKEFELLSTLVENQGRVMTREELLDAVWGKGYSDKNRTLDVHIKRLRSRIETNPNRPKHLITIRGRGYKFSQ